MLTVSRLRICPSRNSTSDLPARLRAAGRGKQPPAYAVRRFDQLSDGEGVSLPLATGGRGRQGDQSISPRWLKPLPQPSVLGVTRTPSAGFRPADLQDAFGRGSRLWRPLVAQPLESQGQVPSRLRTESAAPQQLLPHRFTDESTAIVHLIQPLNIGGIKPYPDRPLCKRFSYRIKPCPFRVGRAIKLRIFRRH